MDQKKLVFDGRSRDQPGKWPWNVGQQVSRAVGRVKIGLEHRSMLDLRRPVLGIVWTYTKFTIRCTEEEQVGVIILAHARTEVHVQRCSALCVRSSVAFKPFSETGISAIELWVEGASGVGTALPDTIGVYRHTALVVVLHIIALLRSVLHLMRRNISKTYNSWKIDNHRNLKFFKLFTRSNTAKHQDLWCIESAAGHNDFPRRKSPSRFSGIVGGMPGISRVHSLTAEVLHTISTWLLTLPLMEENHCGQAV